MTPRANGTVNVKDWISEWILAIGVLLVGGLGSVYSYLMWDTRDELKTANAHMNTISENLVSITKVVEFLQAKDELIVKQMEATHALMQKELDELKRDVQSRANARFNKPDMERWADEAEKLNKGFKSPTVTHVPLNGGSR